MKLCKLTYTRLLGTNKIISYLFHIQTVSQVLEVVKYHEVIHMLNTAEYGVLLSIYSLWKLEREIEWMMRVFWKIRQRTYDSKRYSHAQTNVCVARALHLGWARPHVHVK